MNRNEFENLRDSLKKIDGDIELKKFSHGKTVIYRQKVMIVNDLDYELEMKIEINPRRCSKTINVTCRNISGPICRIESNAPAHYVDNENKKSRNHKHSLQNENSHQMNLNSGAVSRNDISGKTIKEIFDIFCKESNIKHNGEFIEPEEELC